MNDPLLRKSTRGNFHLIEQQKIQIQKKVDFIIFTARNYILEPLSNCWIPPNLEQVSFYKKTSIKEGSKQNTYIYSQQQNLQIYIKIVAYKTREISICEYWEFYQLGSFHA